MSRVAVTGAGGRIGTRVLPKLVAHDILAIDIEPLHTETFEGIETRELDIVADTDALRQAFTDRDVVVHLAARSSSGEPWERILRPNIDGTYKVYEAAVEAGVGRVIFASSNHVVHMRNVTDPAEQNTMQAGAEALSIGSPMAPTGPYGISKVTGEAIGSYCAARYDIEVLNLRIGSALTDEQLLAYQDENDAIARYHRAMFLSIPDAVHGLDCAIDAQLPDNPLTVYLTSRNTERTLSITPAMRALGYDPRDDSAEIVRQSERS